MNDLHDLELTLGSRVPLVSITSSEEKRVIGLLEKISKRQQKPLFQWTATEGLRRLDELMLAQKHNSTPTTVLQHIKTMPLKGYFVLIDFHPYLDDPMHIRLLKEIALDYSSVERTVVFLSHDLSVPAELQPYSAQFELSMPDEQELEQIVSEVASSWTKANLGKKVKADRKSLSLLVKNLNGLTSADAKRLARTAIFDDGAVTQSDVTDVMKAKYDLINQNGVLSFEYETAAFGEVAGLEKMKHWLEQRHSVFHGENTAIKLDPPRGMLLLGVQGCGKSLAAKAVAGTWNVPLLRLDFGAVYDKFIGETEKNLRDSLKNAQVLAPCVLWLDEIEKGVATGGNDAGTSRRVLGSLLTWMAEKKESVFLVATANDVTELPPELLRKGRFDEIFFVDLPTTQAREDIFRIHLEKRDVEIRNINISQLSELTEGFSGAEIETAIVSALYSACATGGELTNEHLIEEVKMTRPLSVLMAEKIEGLRSWAANRTVPAG